MIANQIKPSGESPVKPKVLIVLLFLFTAGFAGTEEFVSFGSGVCRFNLQDYELSKPLEDAIVFGVSRILDTYKDTFGFSYSDSFKVKVTIFSSKDKFLEYQKEQCGSIISQTGYYSGVHGETVVLINKDAKKIRNETKRMVGTVFHEANHLILRYQIPWCPTWVNEGLSEYFEGLNVFGKNKRIFLQKRRIKWCKRWLKKGFPITLKEYIGLSYGEWMNLKRRDSNTAYTMGYSLVYFMMSRKSTEKVLKELLWEFRRQGMKADSIQTINNCYPGGLEKFEKMWLKWIPRARPYRPLRALRKEAAKNRPRHWNLLDRETLAAVEKIDNDFALWFGAENRYEAALQSEKEEIIKQWIADAQSSDLQKRTKAIAALGNVAAKDAVEVLVSIAEEPMSNNLPKWMAVRALGKIGDKAAVPILIELVDHDDWNTRVYARVSLAEITGVYFGDDKEKWREWRN